MAKNKTSVKESEVGKEKNTGKKFVAVPLEWHVPVDHVTPFASNIVIQIEEDIFKLSFFEVKPPIHMDESTPPPAVVRAECVASVYITPNKVGLLIELLRKHLERYKSITKKE
jgi:hypothetical protein